MIQKNQSPLAILCAATLLAANLWWPTTQAAPFEWNTTDGVFNTAGNWDPTSGPPATGDDAHFRVADDYSVDLTGDPAIDGLYVGHGFTSTQQVTLTNATLTTSKTVAVHGAAPRRIFICWVDDSQF